MNVLGYALYLLAGMTTGAAIVVASLKYYVDIGDPYVDLALVFITLQLIAVLVRKARGKPRQLRAAIFAVAIEAAAFAIGGLAAMYGLIAIYPPNFN